MPYNAELTGRRSEQREGYPEAQLLGGPVERRVGPSTMGVGRSLSDNENEAHYQNDECKDRSPSH